MKIDKNFTNLSKISGANKIWLTFPNKNKRYPKFILNTKGCNYLLSLGANRFSTHVSKDNRFVVLSPSEYEGVSIAVKHNPEIRQAYLLDLIASILKDDKGIKFEGVIDDVEKNITFDFTKPVYY